jgi:transcriptional regulator GlxA family with amidase domain
MPFMPFMPCAPAPGGVAVRDVRVGPDRVHVSRGAPRVREVLAEELLATGRITIEQVAERVGYSTASSFVHAFTRWKGVAPRRWARGSA